MMNCPKCTALKAKVKAALLHPLKVLGVWGLIILLLLEFVIPRLGVIYASFGAVLPYSTQFLMDTAALVQRYFLLLLVAPVAARYGLIRWTATPAGRRWLDEKLLGAPHLGDLIRKVAAACISRTLSTQLGSGIPIAEALETAAATAGNSVLADAVLAAREPIRQGASLNAALKASGICPDGALSMMAVGEETGSLDAVLAKIADFYEEEADADAKFLAYKINTLAVVDTVLIIATITAALITPMFGISSLSSTANADFTEPQPEWPWELALWSLICAGLNFVLWKAPRRGPVLPPWERVRDPKDPIERPAGVPVQSEPAEDVPAIAGRWVLVFLRAIVIAAVGLGSLGLAAISLTQAYEISIHTPAEDWKQGIGLVFLLPFPLGAVAARLGWLCWKAGAATVSMAKGRSPAALDSDMPLSFSSFIFLIVTMLILASVIFPSFSGLLRKADEGAGKGNIGEIRSALSLCYGDLNGRYPATLDALTVGGKYLASIPRAKAPNFHPDSSAVHYGTKSDDAGGWLYNNVPGDRNTGSVMVNCTHTDTKNSVWTSY